MVWFTIDNLSLLEKHCLKIFCQARHENASLSMKVPSNQGKKSKVIVFLIWRKVASEPRYIHSLFQYLTKIKIPSI